MTPSMVRKDLIVLVADKQTEATIDSFLRHRHRSLGIRQIQFEIVPHPRKDPGCLLEAHLFLKPFLKSFERSLVIFDHDGCGQEARSIGELSRSVEERLTTTGWNAERTQCIVIQPELEIWVWSDSSEVDRICDWLQRNPGLREWLVSQGWIAERSAKPDRPKEALEAALKEVHKLPSSALFREMARVVGLGRCADPSFLKLKSTLRNWFPL